MTMDLVFPRLPPAFDAIGEYTAILAEHLAPFADVRILTSEHDPSPVAGARIERVFDEAPRRSIAAIARAVVDRRPDALLVQYNPFSYGHRGVNPWLAPVLARVRRGSPSTRIVLVAHETHIEPATLRKAVLCLAHRVQLAVLLRHVDRVASTIEAWVPGFGRAVGAGRVTAIPIGSNVPLRIVPRPSARSSLGLPKDAILVGVFGKVRPERRIDWVAGAVDAARRRGVDARLFYVGPDVERVHRAAGSVPVVSTGPLPIAAVPDGLCAMDLCATPFRRGVSGRRGSFIAALQHGIPTVSTAGPDTDRFLREGSGAAFELVPDSDREAFDRTVIRLCEDAVARSEIGDTGRRFHDTHFSWTEIARSHAEFCLGARAPDPGR